jgi:hypothetical protein
LEKIFERNAKMNEWIFLSKGGKDPYINVFAQGCRSKTTSTDDFTYSDCSKPIVLRGILKDKIMKNCWKDGRDFYYMDTGYFGNESTVSNPNGWKYWHRITKNNLQLDDILLERPNDRWRLFKKEFKPWKKGGRNIILAVPDEKPCKFYGFDLEEWKENTIREIQQHTDRSILIRERVKNRSERTLLDPLDKVLIEGDVHALVTFNSNAAIESIFNGIPAFVLAPCHAAKPVARTDICFIEDPFYADSDLLEHWARHLSYGQFHVDELRSGKAKKMLEEYFP